MNRLIVIPVLLSLMTAPVCGQKTNKVTTKTIKKLAAQTVKLDTKSGDCFGGKEHNPTLQKSDSLKRDSIAAVKTPAKKDYVKTDSVRTAKVINKK